MKISADRMRLYAVTDRSWLKGGETLEEAVQAALAGGVTILQLREKHASHGELVAAARRLKPVCEAYGVPLIIDDDVEAVLESGADGVHVGQEDMAVAEARRILGPDKIIGASAHSEAEAREAVRQGADYLGCGAVFATATKNDTTPLSREELRRICRSVEVPAVAIGGITEANCMELAASGIAGIAVVSAIFAAEDKRAAARRLRLLAERIAGKRRAVLTIAGSDCSGGAGIQADLKTMLANGVYGMSAITALTAQNTTGVYGILESTPEFLASQLDCIFGDIRPDAVKTGMVSSAGLIRVIGGKLKEYGAEHIVVDPVMVSTSGSKLLQEEAMEALTSVLLPMAEVITPNIPEAEVLSGMEIASAADMETAAEKIFRAYGCAVLCKGGHSLNDANDLLCDGEGCTWFAGRKIDNPNTHGTGCTLSSAIAANLAKGMELREAVAVAKEYISGALAAGLDLGKGSGPLDHGFAVDFSGKTE